MFIWELIGAIMGFIAMVDESNNCGKDYSGVGCLAPEGASADLFVASLVMEVLSVFINFAMIACG